jgi:non-ribosomal peptide synthetase component F
MPEHFLRSNDGDNDESLTIDGVHTLPELFTWQAARRAGATLFSFQDTQSAGLTTLSYANAHARSCSLADALAQRLPESRNLVVGIWFERSIDLHLAVLATTFAGAAWLPFDADIPAERVKACLADSHAAVLLCDDAHREAYVQGTDGLSGCQVVTFESLCQETTPTASARAAPQPEDTAYIIYTSGSSGTPKGIEISHNAALNFSLSERAILGTGPDDIVWQGFSAAFDMFIEET